MYTAQKDINSRKSNGNIISIVILGLSIAIAFFFTRIQYYQYMENKDILANTRKEAKQKGNTLAQINALSEKITTDTDIMDGIERYAGTFREDAILNSLFIPINGISISNISMSKGEKLPNGLSEANISVAFQSEDITVLNNFLEYLTTKKSNKKSYVIKNFSFPFDTTKNETIASTIELGMFYLD